MFLIRPGLRAILRLRQVRNGFAQNKRSGHSYSVGTVNVSPIWLSLLEGLALRKASSSSGVASGDGDGRVTLMATPKHGCLWGNGEMSIMSQAGDDEGIGGVVAPS